MVTQIMRGCCGVSRPEDGVCGHKTTGSPKEWKSERREGEGEEEVVVVRQ